MRNLRDKLQSIIRIGLSIMLFLSVFTHLLGQTFVDSIYAQSRENLNIAASVQGVIYYSIEPKPLYNISEHSTVIELEADDELGDSISGIDFKLRLEQVDGSYSFFSSTFQFDSNGKASVSIPYEKNGHYEIILYHEERRTSHIDGEEYFCYWNSVLPPVVNPLEEKVKEKDAILTWNEPEDPGNFDYQYLVQISTDPGFNNIVKDSGWIDAREFDFSDLDKRTEYYLRVKARESNGGTSEWSIVQSTRIKTTVASVVDDVAEAVSNTFSKASASVKKGYEAIGNNVVKVFDPVLRKIGDKTISGSTSGVMVGTTVANLWLLSFEVAKFPYLFLQVILNILGILGLRKKGTPYGMVYDSVTKEPINKAIVRIYNAMGKLVRTDVTNIYGIFTAELSPGEYKLQVHVPGYRFPSELLSSKSDYPYQDLYYGGYITIKENEPVDYSIPVDPVKAQKIRFTWVKLRSRVGQFIKVLSPILLVLSFILSLYLVFKYEDMYSDWMLLIYVPSFIIALRTWMVQIKKFGIVQDEKEREVQGIEVGIKELDYDRLVGKRVTSEGGLYRFILPPGKYQLEVLDSNYKVLGEDSLVIEYESKNDKPIIVNKDIRVDKKDE